MRGFSMRRLRNVFIILNKLNNNMKKIVILLKEDYIRVDKEGEDIIMNHLIIYLQN